MSPSLLGRPALLSSVRAFPIALLGGAVALATLNAAAAQTAAPAATTAAPAAAAAPASGEVEEVTITARDRAEKAQDVPLSLSAVGAKTLQREHIESWKDVVQKVPSFTPAVANPRTGANGLRGITGISGGTDGSEGDVGIIVDNVFYTHIGFSWLTNYDIAGLQVARGPQGTLLGKNTTVGAVIITTNEPSFEPQTTTETTFGTRRLVEETITNTGTLIPDTVAYRISAFGKKQDGFITNLLDPAAPKGQDVDRWAVRGQLLGVFGDVTDRLIFEYLTSNETNNSWGYYQDNWTVNFNGLPRTINTIGAQGAKTFNNPESALLYLFPQYSKNIQAPTAWANSYTSIGSIVTQTKGVSNELNWRIGDYTLTSVSAWRSFFFHPNNSNGNYGINLYQNNLNGYDVNVEQTSQELRISSPTGEKIDYTAGLYFLREVVDSNLRQQYGSDAVAYLTQNNTGATNPIYNSAILNGVEGNRYGRAGITNFSQFGQLNYHYDEKATLTLGVRNSYEVRFSDDTGYYFGGASSVKGLTAQQLSNLRTNYVAAGIGGTNFNIGGVQKTDSISFLVNPSYKFNDNILGYFNVARGVKSGAANTDAVPIITGNNAATWNKYGLFTVTGYNQPITLPETAYDVELGFKSNWLDNKLQVNADVYVNEIYNFQAKLVNYINVNGQQVPFNQLGNVPHVRLAGFETDGRYQIIEDLWLTWAGAYNGAWYVSFPNAGAPPDFANSKGAPSSINLSGKAIPNVTPYTFALGGNYEWAAGEFLGLNWRGYAYENQFFKSNTMFSLGREYTRYVLSQGAYVVFNAGVGFKTSDGKYDVVLWGKNLLNKQAYNSLNMSTNLAYNAVTWIDPLTIGVTLRTKF